jgi:hypothetical protein
MGDRPWGQGGGPMPGEVPQGRDHPLVTGACARRGGARRRRLAEPARIWTSVRWGPRHHGHYEVLPLYLVLGCRMIWCGIQGYGRRGYGLGEVRGSCADCGLGLLALCLWLSARFRTVMMGHTKTCAGGETARVHFFVECSAGSCPDRAPVFVRVGQRNLAMLQAFESQAEENAALA